MARRQLLGLGFGSRAIEHRLGRGRLHPVHRGVYAVGRPELSREGEWMAAVLACGPGAALSHSSAAALWGIRAERAGPIRVTVRTRREIRRSGIRVHARPALPAARIGAQLRIPVTQPVQTLVDLATELGDSELERAVNEADVGDLVDPEALRAALDHHSGEPGAPRLGLLLDRHTFHLSDSELEVLFCRIVAPAGLPPPRTKARVLGFQADFHFPGLGLIVETDGLRYHRTPSQQAHATRRDQTHTAAGLRVLRFTHYEVKYESARVRAVLARTAAQIRVAPRGGPPATRVGPG